MTTSLFVLIVCVFASLLSLVTSKPFRSSGAGKKEGVLTTYTANSSAFTYSPYAWAVTSASASTINSASSFRTLFSGSFLNLTFDVSSMVVPASQLYWRVDNGPLTPTTISSVIPITIFLTDVPYHTLEVMVKSTTERANRWFTGVNSTRVIFTGLITDGELVPFLGPTLNVLIYGDSITEGVLTLGGAAPFDTDHNDASVVYSFALGKLLGVEMGVVGFGATGLSRGGSGSVPALGTSWNQLFNGTARVFTPKPDLIIFNEGTNDGNNNITASFISVLNSLMAACPNTPVAIMLPFNGAQKDNLLAIVAATPGTTFVDTTGFYNQTLGGALHPTGPNDVARIAPQLAAKLRPILAKGIAAAAAAQEL
jgi:hypothetical protein